MDAAGGVVVSEEQDLEDIRPRGWVRVAGGALIGTGVFAALLGLQTIALVARWTPYMAVTAALQCGLGVVAVFLGARLMRMRGWAARAGVAVLALLALTNVVWFGYALTQGVLSLLALVLVPSSALSALAAGLCIPVTGRADRARLRLRDRGFDAGD